MVGTKRKRLRFWWLRWLFGTVSRTNHGMLRKHGEGACLLVAVSTREMKELSLPPYIYKSIDFEISALEVGLPIATTLWEFPLLSFCSKWSHLSIQGKVFCFRFLFFYILVPLFSYLWCSSPPSFINIFMLSILSYFFPVLEKLWIIW